ncbi:MAG TPA: tetratricopeptide repeat protein [Bacteroidota bacterium]
MHLRPASSLFAAACFALLSHGCAGDVPPHLRTAASRERELDSVILRCRTSLGAAPGDADIHTRLGEALLERVMMHEMSFRNLVWTTTWANVPILKNAGGPIDRVAAMHILDTLKEAESHIATAVATKPDNAAAWRAMGRLYMTQGWGGPGDSMYKKATALFDTSLALEPSSAEGYYGLGCSLFKRNRSPEALAALSKSLSFDSLNGSAYLTLGEVYMDTGNVTVAFACFENAARLGLKSAGEYIQIAEHYLDEQAERKLLGRFGSLRTQAPDILKPTVRAGLRMLSIYHPGIAMDLSSRALEIDSTCAEAYLLRSGLYLAERDSASAFDEYLRAFEIGTAPYWSYSRFPRELLERAYERMPDNDDLLYLLGQPFVNTTETASSATAITLFQDAVQRRPKSAIAAYLLGQAYAIRQDTVREIEWFDRAIALPPERPAFMYWRIHQAYLEAGRIPKSVYVYQKFLVEDGGWILQMLRNVHGTKRYARERVLLAAAYCAIGYECSWKVQQGKPGYWKDRAIEQFTRATEIIPESAVPYLGLGSLYIDLGEKEAAIRYYRKAAAMGSADAVESLKRMDMRE